MWYDYSNGYIISLRVVLQRMNTKQKRKEQHQRDRIIRAAAKVLTSDLEEKDTLTRIEHVLER